MSEAGEETVNIKSVQISDLEDTVRLTGWEVDFGSPESWCRARQNMGSSDIFSFGMVMMIYVMTGKTVFHVGWDKLDAEDAWRHVLSRHILYFADEEGLNGLLKHIQKENPFFERLASLVENVLRQPFEGWGNVEPELKNLIGKMTCLDPSRRITAARGAPAWMKG
ncbi:hypothetical protein TEQG_00964 [Trichophyton equinum CBS 127.97]|uniref:Protein kinase domain-containing protein n=1 Tax=Trichophyton equinum (strain ATCC MYA-4606 / CBS 127.97) TaxID=559882 RepID=F2PJ55_TRIEC|nr:hypothetical protein TEQG_00964 [Trichophyton equinum CBS 127.97]